MQITSALLPLLTACHVFADGEISLTCDELPDCESDADTDADTDTDFDLELSAGLALSSTDTERWLATAYKPPALDAHLEKGGPGTTTGAVAWSPDRNRLLLAADGVLYSFGPGSADISRFEIPTDEPVRDIEPIGTEVYLITENWLMVQSGPSAELSLINDNGDGLDFRAMTADGTDLYVISSEGDDGPDLYVLDTTAGESQLLSENFAESDARINGDIFFHTDGTLMSCSVVGAIYSVDDMLAGEAAPEVFAFVDSSIEDVVACGQDELTGLFMVVSADSGLFLTAAGEDEIQVSLAEPGHTIDSAYIY